MRLTFSALPLAALGRALEIAAARIESGEDPVSASLGFISGSTYPENVERLAAELGVDGEDLDGFLRSDPAFLTLLERWCRRHSRGAYLPLRNVR